MQTEDTHAHRNNHAKLIRTAPGTGAGPGLTQGAVLIKLAAIPEGALRAYSSAQEERNPRETALPATMVGGPRRRRFFSRLGP